MKKTISILTLLLLLVTACQSTTPNPRTSEPLRNTPVNIFISAIKPQALGAMAVTVESGNLFSNGGFESGLDSWGVCAEGTVSITDKAYEGNNALNLKAGNCFYQSVEANPEQEFNLSCFVNVLSGEGWTGMGLSFSDANWNMISEPAPAVISSTGFNQYNVGGTAPANTKHVSMWLYSENPTAVDNCSLMLNEPAPPPPPAQNSNLLENGGFESANYSENWLFDCTSLWSDVTDAYAGNTALAIQDGTCVDQSLSASDIEVLKGNDFTYSCYVKNPRNYGSISIFFDDEPVYKEVTNSNEYQLVEIKGTAPNDLTNGFVSAYGDGSLLIDNCSLSVEGGSTEPIIINESRVLETEGTSLDIEGNTMVIGTPTKNLFSERDGEDSGKVEVFSKTVNGWQRDAEILPATTMSSFGRSVAIHEGDIYVTSDRFIDIYSRNNVTNQWDLIQTLEDPNWFPYRQGNPGIIVFRSFYSGGTRLAITDNTLLVAGGAILTNGANANFTFNISLFTKSPNDSQWQFTKTLDKNVLWAGRSFKQNILLEGDELYISQDDGESAVNYYGRNVGGENNWGLVQKIDLVNSPGNRFIGKSFVRNGNYLTISSEASTQLYELTSSNETPWVLVGDFATLFPNLPEKSIFVGGTTNRLLISNLDANTSSSQQRTSEVVINVVDTTSENYENWKVIAKLRPDSITENGSVGFYRNSGIDRNTFALRTVFGNSRLVRTFDIP